jgi:uncharacterized protein YbjT (DUF2867 family)
MSETSTAQSPPEPDSESVPVTAIVIGATGVVGRALVDQLAAADHIGKVVSLTRRAVSHDNVKVDNHVVDFEQLHKHRELFQGDCLFSCLGTTRKQAGSIAAQRRVDLDYQLSAAQLAAEQGVKHYLLVSSSGANARSFSPYLKMKGELEQAVLGLSFERISLFRPSLLLGERSDSRVGEKLASQVLPGLCKLPGLAAYRPIRGDLVAAKMVEVSAEEGPVHQCFNLDEVFP